MTFEIQTANPQPTHDRERIDSLDILRGFSLLGILVMNIQSFGMPVNTYLIPNSYGDLDGINGLVWLIGFLFFDLKFMAMFSMMFGAGIILFTDNRDARKQPVLRVHYRRMFLLLVFGLIHAYVIWHGDILVAYAICGMWVVWVRKWSPKGLLITGVWFFIIGSFFHLVVGLSTQYFPETAEQLRADFALSASEQRSEIESFQGSWRNHLPIRMKEAASIQFFVFPFMFFWRISGLMLIGMALYKWKVLNASRPSRFYKQLAVIGGGLGLPVVAGGAYLDHTKNFDPAFVLGYGAIPNWYGSLGVALMWIAIIMLIAQSNKFPRIKHALSAYGRLAFTNYIGQSILATWVFYGYGLALMGTLDRLQQVGIVIIIWTVQLIISVYWVRYFRFGPLEWIWRSGVYMRPQPMRRKT